MRNIKFWVKATLLLAFLVIIAGGVVRTTQSGMGCPDWPRCFGSWIPPTNASQLPPNFEHYLRAQDIDHTFNVYHTWIEYLNRLLGALLGLFAVIQASVLFRRRTAFPSASRLAYIFLGTVILTGLFGALVVKLNLANLSITVHLFFAWLLIQLQLALHMNVNGQLNKKTAGRRVRRTLLILLGLILIQAFLGTAVRMYVDDVSRSLHFEQREAWLAKAPLALIIHRSFSVFVLLAVFYASRFCRKVTALCKYFNRLKAIVLLSMTTGIILYYLDMPAIAQPLHLLLGTLAISQTMFMLLYTKNSTDLLKPQKIPAA